MRHAAIDPQLFIINRKNLKRLLLPDSLVVVNSNDVLPANGDALLPLRQNSDLFYLTGIDQEESLLLLCPDAQDEKLREILFLREASPLLETWEGHKLTKAEVANLSGVLRVEWLSEFRPIFHRLMCECGHVYLNSNENPRAVVVVETRDARFARETQRRYPLHDYHRLARLMRRLRAVKSDAEIALLRKACEITAAGFRRVCRFVKPGVTETEIEAEYAHEFIRRGGQFAYDPIIASGKNTCTLHYVANDRTCRSGDLLLLDVAASHAHYNADLTRTIPVSGRLTRRQKQVYNAVLRVLRGASAAVVPGKLTRDWQKEAEGMIAKELVDLGLLKMSEIKKPDPDSPAFKKYFMHGIGHTLGLDVHDVTLGAEPIPEGAVLTVEPGIYIREEGLGIRLENDIIVRKGGNVDLMEKVPIEADDVERLMR
jgi:Xaa-Pro aminopeptidase